MLLSISFRKCIVDGDFITVKYDGTPNVCRENYEVKNTKECEEVLKQSIETLKQSQPAGTYYISLQETGRKVRGFNDFVKDNKYIEVK